MTEDHSPNVSIQQSTHDNGWDKADDYSYAYYEPGPPRRHTNIPPKRMYREGSYTTHHTYVTRYGTEENIYEEISDRSVRHSESMSLNQSLLKDEVRRVQCGHKRVLEELNLAVEAMIMPSNSHEDSDVRENYDKLSDLSKAEPTDDLLTSMPLLDIDSGFSGSSSGASYRSVTGSLRRELKRPKSSNSRLACSSTSDDIISNETGKGFWGKKAWKKITSFPSNINLNKSRDDSCLQSRIWKNNSQCDSPTPNCSERSLDYRWCSSSEHELSSDEGTYKSRNNGQLRNTINKALTLCDKLKGSSSPTGHRLSSDSTIPVDLLSMNNNGRLSRWFSIRRNCLQYDIKNSDSQKSPRNRHKLPLLPEVEEENCFLNCTPQQRGQLPPCLPPPPQNLDSQQLKRRMIIASIVHSENSYVSTLQRLVNDYKKPLEESNPPILSNSKINTLFHRLPEILQCHSLFRIALAECLRNWDEEEKIGDLFVASFSKTIVLDIYSGYINNFSIAMDLTKTEANKKAAFADFMKVKQVISEDRLSFFGLMVKPVQRFPQFILFLQDLLKYTPQGHHDRMSLQLALTQLESLAELLNEKKREAEQYQAFKGMLKNISGKFSGKSLCDENRYLLREDNVAQIEYSQCGNITKTRSRRLLLLNDLVICVSASSKVSNNFGSNERLSLKWTCPVSDIEILDSNISPTLNRVLTSGVNKECKVKSKDSLDVINLCTEMSELMNDYEIMSRISDLVQILKGSYPDITLDNIRRILQQIQLSIQEKDEEISWVDSCCLQLVIKTKGKEDILTFQTENTSIKSNWITELRLAQLALDSNNSPAWEIQEENQGRLSKIPLFVRSQCIYRSHHQTEVRCGCYFTVNLLKATKRRQNQNFLWTSTWNGVNSYITIMGQHHQQTGVLKEFFSFSLMETEVTAMEFAKGTNSQYDTVWIGTKNRKIFLYSAIETEKDVEFGSTTVPDAVNQIKYYYDNVFVALKNGSILIYNKNSIDNTWLLLEPHHVILGSDQVTCLLPINMNIYASCGNIVYVLDAVTGNIQKNFSLSEHPGSVNLLAHSGIGLWISLRHSGIICLYHTETFKHLQDIDVASSVTRLSNSSSRSQVNVTALLACKGLLWVGTNVGIILTIPLPRLEGVPIISGRVNISYHAHFGPISFLISLQPKNYNNQIKRKEELKEKKHNEKETIPKQHIEKQLPDAFDSNSPVILRRGSKVNDGSRHSKTLPRCFGNTDSIFSTNSSSSDACNIYGLYGDLMFVKNYGNEDDAIYESARSDSELADIPNRISTLDRRLRVSRPRSLDLSNWSVESRFCSTTSSDSEENLSIKQGQSVSSNDLNEIRELDSVFKNHQVASNNKHCIQNCNHTKKTNSKTLTKNMFESNGSKTIITITGGRGYINWRQPCCTADKLKNSSPLKYSNSNDSYLVIWELKL